MEDQIREFVGDYRSRRIDRGEFLKWASVLGIGGALAGESLARAPRTWASGGAAPVRGGTLKVGGTVATSIEPPLLVDGTGVAIVQQVGEYLVTVENGVVKPHLALSWKPSQGGQVWTFTLRQGVTFQSGKPLTAADVVATFKRLVDPKQASSAQSSLTFLKPTGISAVDAHTVQFSLEQPVVDFPLYLYGVYQAVILPASYSGNFAKNADGTGPYKLVEYVPGERARYVRNPAYWNKPLPYLDSVELVLGYSADSLITALLGGSVDTLITTPEAQVPIISGNSAFKILTVQSSAHNGIFVRTDQKPFSDVRVRQAVALALNRPAIVSTVQQSLAVLGNDNVFAPVFPEYVATPQRTQNIAQAKSLLAAAGYARGFSIDVTTTSDTVNLVPLAIAAGQMLATVGIDVALQAEPGSVYYNTDWLDKPFTVTDWAHRPTPSQFINVAYRTGAIWNASHWSNARFDSLSKQLDSTIDLSQRKALARQLEVLETDQAPSFITFFRNVPRPVKAKLQGVNADPASYLDLSQAYWSA